MTERRHLKALLRRPLSPSDLPIVIRRKPWAVGLSIVLLPLFAGLGVLAFWASLQTYSEPSWFLRIWLIVIGLLITLGIRSGLDFVWGYKLVIDIDGVWLGGKLDTRHFRWDEIAQFATWRNQPTTATGFGVPMGYQAVIQVDGSNNPARLMRNLWFKGYFTAPFMELGGKDLVKLLNKAKRQFESAV